MAWSLLSCKQSSVPSSVFKPVIQCLPVVVYDLKDQDINHILMMFFLESHVSFPLSLM